MKTIALIVLALVLFAACENLESSIKQEDDSFRTTKTSLKNYNTKSYNTNVYVDTSENYLLRNDKQNGK
jgi:hypothetical protein